MQITSCLHTSKSSVSKWIYGLIGVKSLRVNTSINQTELDLKDIGYLNLFSQLHSKIPCIYSLPSFLFWLLTISVNQSNVWTGSLKRTSKIHSLFQWSVFSGSFVKNSLSVKGLLFFFPCIKTKWVNYDFFFLLNYLFKGSIHHLYLMWFDQVKVFKENVIKLYHN